MKKLLLAAALAFVGLVAVNDASAWRRYGYGCNTCHKTCHTACKERVIEQPCEPAPTCCRYVRVEEPAIRTKHVSYSWACPPTCAQENAANQVEEVENY